MGHLFFCKHHEFCVGIGRDHAKFSPVGTASYRLMPHIILKQPIYNEQALKLQSYFAPGVISVEKDRQGNEVAKVANARLDTCNRQVLTDRDWKFLRRRNMKDGSMLINIYIFILKVL